MHTYIYYNILFYFWVKIHAKGVITLKKLILILMIIGGLNWGLVGILNFNLVTTIFGPNFALITRIIYAAVGLASLYGITFLFVDERRQHA